MKARGANEEIKFYLILDTKIRLEVLKSIFSTLHVEKKVISKV
jgi:hypothetical protein